MFRLSQRRLLKLDTVTFDPLLALGSYPIGARSNWIWLILSDAVGYELRSQISFGCYRNAWRDGDKNRSGHRQDAHSFAVGEAVISESECGLWEVDKETIEVNLLFIRCLTEFEIFMLQGEWGGKWDLWNGDYWSVCLFIRHASLDMNATYSKRLRVVLDWPWHQWKRCEYSTSATTIESTCPPTWFVHNNRWRPWIFDGSKKRASADYHDWLLWREIWTNALISQCIFKYAFAEPCVAFSFCRWTV